jgi:hypothetical protein
MSSTKGMTNQTKITSNKTSYEETGRPSGLLLDKLLDFYHIDGFLSLVITLR